jgi:hypothetical protein
MTSPHSVCIFIAEKKSKQQSAVLSSFSPHSKPGKGKTSGNSRGSGGKTVKESLLYESILERSGRVREGALDLLLNVCSSLPSGTHNCLLELIAAAQMNYAQVRLLMQNVFFLSEVLQYSNAGAYREICGKVK